MFEKVGFALAHRVLEIGCGTGGILGTLPHNTHTILHGIDIFHSTLAEARSRVPDAFLACADGGLQPFPAGLFDIVYCHYVLLWVDDPLQVLKEMKRVTTPGGHILALAEPDYMQRWADQPEISALTILQTESLRKQGADVTIGSRLAELFRQADIRINEAGQIQRGNLERLSQQEWELEWKVFESDVAGSVTLEDRNTITYLKKKGRSTAQSLLYVPTYFACGQV